jgi:cytidylate kinase
MEKYAIAIARGCGSGGRRIGQKLADLLKIDFVDRELLRFASEESGISEALFGRADERITLQSMIFRNLRKGRIGEVRSPEQNGFVSDENLFNFQAKVLRGLVEKESFVVIGRAADFILKDNANVLTVNIQASRAHCVRAMMRLNAFSEKEAENFVNRTNRYRADYYEYYTGENWNDPANFDLSLNSGRLADGGCIRIILAAARAKWGGTFALPEGMRL